MDQVLDVLPKNGVALSYVGVHDKMGVWSIITVKHALRQLREEGVVVRIGPHNSPKFARVVKR